MRWPSAKVRAYPATRVLSQPKCSVKIAGSSRPPPAISLALRPGSGRDGANLRRQRRQRRRDIGNDGAEDTIDLLAEGGHRDDTDDGDKADEQAVLDQSRAVLVLKKTCKLLVHNVGTPMGFSDMTGLAKPARPVTKTDASKLR
jgi:hypothetical protein